MSAIPRKAGLRRRAGAMLMLAATLEYTAADLVQAMVNEDYRGTSIRGRGSVAIVKGPGGTRVNTLNANLMVERPELLIPSHGVALDFGLQYNSLLNLENGPFGYGWSFSYGLQAAPQPGGEVLLKWGDGRRDLFVPAGGSFLPLNEGVFVTLASAGTGTYSVCTLQQICYLFDDPSHGKITSISEPGGHRVTLSYDGAARLIAARDTHGFSLLLHYDSLDRVIEVVDSATTPSRSLRYGYDAAGDLVRAEDALGSVTTYGYVCPHLLTRITDPVGSVTTIDYTPAAQVSTIENSVQRSTFSYDLFGLKTSVTERIDASTERTSGFVYDAAHRLVRKIDPLGGVEVSGYGPTGQLAFVTSPGGRTTGFTWNASGDLLTRTDAAGNTQAWSYDPVFHKPLSYLDPLGHVTSMTYDSEGRPISFTYDGINISHITYDSEGRMIAYTTTGGATATYENDAFGNRVAVHPPGGGAPHRFVYDPVHRLVTKITASGDATRFEYDARDRLIRTIDPLGGVYALSYDPLDRPQTFTDPSGRTHAFGRDVIGRLIRYTGPGGAVTIYAYDDASRITALSDPEGHTTSHAYDPLDRRTSRTDPLGNTTSYTYDGDGNRLSRADPNGDLTQYSYDSLNRLVGMDQPGMTDDATYAYDDDGKLTRAVNGHADLEFVYDSVDRLITAQEAIGGRILNFTYDADGNRASLTDPDGGLFAYAYDGLGRITAITDPAGGTSTFTYDAAGRPVALMQPNGTRTAYLYDGANRLLGIDTRRPDSSPVFQGQYSYDAAGNRIRSIENGQIIDYTYDAEARLIGAAYAGGRTIGYSYDADGNRTRLVDSLAGTTDYAYDAADRLVSSTGSDAAAYMNDAQGNRTARADGAGVTTYSYSARNDLVQVVLPGGTAIDYSHDALGRLVRSQGPGGPPERIDFVRDPLAGGNVISEYDGTGSRVARYTSAETMNSYLTYEGPSGTLFLHGDRLRSVRAGTDPSAMTQASFEYLPFGEPLASIGSVGDRSFTGADQETATGLVYLRSRWYDPRTSRFLQPDAHVASVLDPTNLHRYLYTANNPQTYMDQGGEWLLAALVIVAVVVVVVAVVESFSKADDALKKGDQVAKERERIAEMGRNPPQGPDVESVDRSYKENLKGALNDANDAATTFPGTTKTGPADIPEDEAKGLAWLFGKFWDWLFDVKPEDKKPSLEPKESEQGPQSYHMRGANSLDGVEANVCFAQGGAELASCGESLGFFPGPGAGQIYGVAVDPADGTIFEVGEGDPGGLNLHHTLRDGTPIGSFAVPYLGSGRGVTVAGEALIVTQPSGPAGSAALLLGKRFPQPFAQWIFSGPGNPNPLDEIPGASDIQPTGQQGPRGGQVALVSSVIDPGIRTVELILDRPPDVSSTWQLLSSQTNPTGVPSSALGLGAAGLLTTWNGIDYLQKPSTLEVIGTCASPAGPTSYGGDSDPTDGSAWATSPGTDQVDVGGGPGGAPSTDTDGDGAPDGCDSCPTNFDTTQLDSDGDGWGDVCECAPFDPAVHPGAREICGDGVDNDCDGLADGDSPYCAAVADVTGLRLQRAQPEFNWDTVAGAGGYDLIRGRRENLAAAGGTVDLGPVSCIDLGSPDTQTEKDPLVPDTGKAFIYLVRVHHGLASYGQGSGGEQRVPAEGDCPNAP